MWGCGVQQDDGRWSWQDPKAARLVGVQGFDLTEACYVKHAENAIPHSMHGPDCQRLWPLGVTHRPCASTNATRAAGDDEQQH